MGDYSIGFVMEQTLGHMTYSRNLARWAEHDPSIRPTWIPIPPREDDRWSRMPIVRGNMSLLFSLRARDRLKQRQGGPSFDALFFHTQATALCSPGLARRLPVVISLDATPLNMDSVGDGYGHRPDGDGPLDRLKAHLYRRLFRRASALTTWSEWARDSLVGEYRVEADKVAVIPPGVDLAEWLPSPIDPDARGPARLLFVGGDFGRKGGGVLLEAFQAGLSRRCELDIVTGEEAPEGGGPVRVHRGLTPGNPALRRLYAGADLFVLPTLADCSPMAIVEAMAAGLAVVASDVGAISEQVVAGETGLLVPPGDPVALARAISGLLDDPVRRLAYGAAGRRRAERVFDGERNYRALADVLKRCAATHPARRRSACPRMAPRRAVPR